MAWSPVPSLRCSRWATPRYWRFGILTARNLPTRLVNLNCLIIPFPSWASAPLQPSAVVRPGNFSSMPVLAASQDPVMAPATLPLRPEPPALFLGHGKLSGQRRQQAERRAIQCQHGRREEHHRFLRLAGLPRPPAITNGCNTPPMEPTGWIIRRVRVSTAWSPPRTLPSATSSPAFREWPIIPTSASGS